jgi:NADH-quinone oxidoreductase subunit C
VTAREIFDQLRELVPGAVLSFHDPDSDIVVGAGPTPAEPVQGEGEGAVPRKAKDCGFVESHIVVRAEQIEAIARVLHDEPDFRFDFLRSLAGVDYLQRGEIEVVYVLHSYAWQHGIVIKARLPRDRPLLKSVESVWAAANWHEREAFDLLGIHFEGHSNLTRLLLPPDWVGHPLRKDYETPTEYAGIDNYREPMHNIF